MDRRTFLLRSTYFLAGTLFGLNGIYKASAMAGVEPEASPRIAIIIDDIGYSLHQAGIFLNLEIPITFSILPRLERTFELSAEINACGHEIMLHQPMEPHNKKLNPGPGALYVQYEEKTIAGVIEENIATVPHALGVNNHMGSRFTENSGKINEVLNVIQNNALFFVDSYTSSNSVGYKEAFDRKIPSAYRNVFLDNQRNEKYILTQLNKLRAFAIKYGRAVGIGHPFPETARAISHFFAKPGWPSCSLVHISKILSA